MYSSCHHLTHNHSPTPHPSPLTKQVCKSQLQVQETHQLIVGGSWQSPCSPNSKISGYEATTSTTSFAATTASLTGTVVSGAIDSGTAGGNPGFSAGQSQELALSVHSSAVPNPVLYPTISFKSFAIGDVALFLLKVRPQY